MSGGKGKLVRAALAFLRRVGYDYWRFLVSDGARDKHAAIAEWEQWEGRPHPRRDEL